MTAGELIKELEKMPAISVVTLVEYEAPLECRTPITTIRYDHY